MAIPECDRAAASSWPTPRSGSRSPTTACRASTSPHPRTSARACAPWPSAARCTGPDARRGRAPDFRFRLHAALPFLPRGSVGSDGLGWPSGRGRLVRVPSASRVQPTSSALGGPRSFHCVRVGTASGRPTTMLLLTVTVAQRGLATVRCLPRTSSGGALLPPGGEPATDSIHRGRASRSTRLAPGAVLVSRRRGRRASLDTKRRPALSVLPRRASASRVIPDGTGRCPSSDEPAGAPLSDVTDHDPGVLVGVDLMEAEAPIQVRGRVVEVNAQADPAKAALAGSCDDAAQELGRDAATA